MCEIKEGNVTRYCKSPSLDENGSLTSAAFQRRTNRNEEYLSVYLLDHFQENSLLQVKQLMENSGFKLKKSGLFSIINIEQSGKYVKEEISEEITYRAINLPHCGIFHESDDLLISELLVECVQETHFIKDI